MFKQNKMKSRIKMCRNYHNKRSTNSDNLSVSVSHNKNNRYSLVKSNENYESIFKHPQFNPRTLENAAVHFGDFYNLQSNNNEGEEYCNNFVGEETASIKKICKSNFTRQMVHKLERATDVKDYARQISIFLKETVEPPDFKLNPFLSENSIFHGSRRYSRYPFWYKEPHKRSLSLIFSNPITEINA